MAKIKKNIKVTQKTTNRLSKSEKLANLTKSSATQQPTTGPKQDIGVPTRKAGATLPPQTQPETPQQPTDNQPTTPAPENRIPDSTLTPDQPSTMSDQPTPQIQPTAEPGAEGQPPSTGQPQNSGAEGAIDDELSEISPSIKKGEQKQGPENKTANKTKDHAKEKGKEAVTKNLEKEAGEQVAKKGLRQVALAAARAAWAAITSAASAVAAAVGWPVLVGCLVVFLIILLIFGGLGCLAINGNFGGVLPDPAGKNDPHVKALIAALSQKVPDAGDTFKFELANERDREFLESGQIDKRLAAALDYLVQKHERIRVSHIVSGYEDTNINPESGAFSDSQITKNISAHRRGQAADIDEIDYLTQECNCGDKIPLKVTWQTIGENPYGTVPDVLNQIDSADDIVSPEIRAALEALGVSGLDQEDLASAILAAPVLEGITSVYDLTDPNVIDAFTLIGVNGLGNKDLQTGLKRAQALKQLYDLNLNDLNSLSNDNVQELLNSAGIPVDEATINVIKQYQASQVLATIKSPADLQRQEVIDALTMLQIDINSPEFTTNIQRMAAADTILNWKGDPNDNKLKEALAVFNISYGQDFADAFGTYNIIQTLFENPQMTTDATVIAFLDSASMQTDSPEAQKAFQIFKSGYYVLQNDNNSSSPEYWNALENLGTDVQGGSNVEKNKENAVKVINKYKSANYLLDYKGDFLGAATDPQFVASLADFGVNLDDSNKDAINKYKATVTLSQASKGKYAPDSQEVKDALKVFGVSSLEDPKAKAAIRVGDATNQNDAQVVQDKNILGMQDPAWQASLTRVQAAKNLLKIKDFSSLQDEQVQNDLQLVGINDPNLLSTIETIGSVQQLLNIKPETIKDAGEQAAMNYLGVNDPKLYSTIGKLGDLQRIMNINDLSDLQSEENQAALRNLNIKDPKVYEYIGKIGSIQTLANIQSPMDLTKPEVLQALGDLNIAPVNMQSSLANAGSIYALTQIRDPLDLLKPENLQALNQLNVINLNAELLGQIGAFQTLLQVRSVGDLLNPNSILALNTLNILSLSNPVTSALMVLSFVDGILGGGLLGGIFGGNCDANTDCYKPLSQKKVHETIGDLLQFPYDEGNPDYYKITQLITYSEERDVLPFAVQLNSLYGQGRNNNVGLFAMPEANDHIHIGY